MHIKILYTGTQQTRATIFPENTFHASFLNEIEVYEEIMNVGYNNIGFVL